LISDHLWCIVRSSFGMFAVLLQTESAPVPLLAAFSSGHRVGQSLCRTCCSAGRTLGVALLITFGIALLWQGGQMSTRAQVRGLETFFDNGAQATGEDCKFTTIPGLDKAGGNGDSRLFLSVDLHFDTSGNIVVPFSGVEVPPPLLGGKTCLSKADQPSLPTEAKYNHLTGRDIDDLSRGYEREDMQRWKLLGKTLHYRVDLSQVGPGCVAAFDMMDMKDNPYRSGEDAGLKRSWFGKYFQGWFSTKYFCDDNASDGVACATAELMSANRVTFGTNLKSAFDSWGASVKFGKSSGRTESVGGYGPGESKIDTNKPFDVDISFNARGLLTVQVTLHQEGRTLHGRRIRVQPGRGPNGNTGPHFQMHNVAEWSDDIAKAAHKGVGGRVLKKMMLVGANKTREAFLQPPLGTASDGSITEALKTGMVPQFSHWNAYANDWYDGSKHECQSKAGESPAIYSNFRITDLPGHPSDTQLSS